jgi:hypothetical protein
MLIKPNGTLYLFEEDGEDGKPSKEKAIFREAREKKLLVCIFTRKGVKHYRLYDPNKPLSEKQKAWREQFGEMAKNGALRRLRAEKKMEKPTGGGK